MELEQIWMDYAERMALVELIRRTIKTRTVKEIEYIQDQLGVTPTMHFSYSICMQ